MLSYEWPAIERGERREEGKGPEGRREGAKGRTNEQKLRVGKNKAIRKSESEGRKEENFARNK